MLSFPTGTCAQSSADGAAVGNSVTNAPRSQHRRIFKHKHRYVPPPSLSTTPSSPFTRCKSAAYAAFSEPRAWLCWLPPCQPQLWHHVLKPAKTGLALRFSPQLPTRRSNQCSMEKRRTSLGRPVVLPALSVSSSRHLSGPTQDTTTMRPSCLTLRRCLLSSPRSSTAMAHTQLRQRFACTRIDPEVAQS